MSVHIVALIVEFNSSFSNKKIMRRKKRESITVILIEKEGKQKDLKAGKLTTIGKKIRYLGMGM